MSHTVSENGLGVVDSALFVEGLVDFVVGLLEGVDREHSWRIAVVWILNTANNIIFLSFSFVQMFCECWARVPSWAGKTAGDARVVFSSFIFC